MQEKFENSAPQKESSVEEKILVQEEPSADAQNTEKESVQKFESAPEGWMTINQLIKTYGSSHQNFKKLTGGFRTDHPEWFKKYLDQSKHVRDHYAPELVQEILGLMNETGIAPEKWLTLNKFVENVEKPRTRVQKIAETFREEHPEWFKKYIDKQRRFLEHYSPELQQEITNRLRDNESELKKFIEKINNPETLSSQEFRSLLNLFGSGAAVDIIYKYHPEFRGLPVEYTRSVIAEYLGNFLVERHGLVLDDLEHVGALTEEDAGLADSLFEIMKQDCATIFQQNRSQGREAIAERVEQYRQKVGDTNSVVSGVIDRTQEYYQKVFDLKPPENIVKQVREGREFPDFNQKINVQEIADKHRLLIADYMGLGKSASAILAKEHLKCVACVIVAPSNVIQTWAGYLNSEREGGYFKHGEEPRVLVIDEPSDAEKLQSETYDYVLISQEKLNDRYTRTLTDLDYDMMIVDEVHKLKNLKEGIRSQNLVQLAEKLTGDSQYLVMLSGTPIPNKIQDIATELKLLYPERFGKQDDRLLARQIMQGDALDLRELLLPRMQRKELGSSFDMPPLTETTQTVTLSGAEKDIYELLLEEDEINASQKIQILRQFLLNPDILEPTPSLTGAKVEAAREYLKDQFSHRDKVVMFVNGYIEGVIRGEKTIIDKLKLSPDISVRVIEGGVNPPDRATIQRELKESSGKMLLIVSGQTADVGVDFSAGEGIYFYNEPWNKADKDQQTSRVHREGVKGAIESTTSITEGTIEEGMHRYLAIKQRAIEKILQGIPTTELEKELIRKDEVVLDENLEVNPELARYYLSSVDRMLKIFSYVKEMGEKDFQEFLQTFGREYAECYLDIGSRSYQGNNSRVTATLLEKMIVEREQDMKEVKILDIASGPEMLRRHAQEDLEPRIFSMDINEHHFEGSESGQAAVGSFLHLPYENESLDYVNMGFALHYTKFLPSRRQFERLEALQEMNRVLKEGGRAIITIVHNLDFKNKEEFNNIASSLGFRVIDEYSGLAESGRQYRSLVITLEKMESEKHQGDLKVEDADADTSVVVLAAGMSREQLDGLKFVENPDSILRDSRHVVEEFTLGGQRYAIEFNNRDVATLDEQKRYLAAGEKLIKEHGSIQQIPPDKIIADSFARVLIGKKYILFKKMMNAGGAVVIRER